jgi:hypothetical protein
LKPIIRFITLVIFISAGSLNAAESLESRIQFLEDQYAIEQLVVVKYGNALDAFDGKAYAALFTSDGVLDLVGNVFSGTAEIEGMFDNPASMGPPPKPGEEPVDFEMPVPELGRIVMQHVITNTSFQIEGNRASGRSYYQEVTTVEGKAQIVNSGHYDDILRKENGLWKFERRNIIQDNPPASSFK